MRIHSRPSIVAAGFLVSLAISASLHGEGSPPLMTDDPGTPGDGHWEIDVGASIERRPGTPTSELSALEVIYGLGETMQLDFALSLQTPATKQEARVASLDSATAGLKWRYLEIGEHGLAGSVRPQIEFNWPAPNSAEHGSAEHEIAFLLPFQFEKTLGPAIVLAELGREFRQAGDAWIYRTALLRQLTSRLGCGAELIGAGDPDFSRSQLALNFAVAIDVGKRSSLLISAGRELHNHADSAATLTGYVGWQLRL